MSLTDKLIEICLQKDKADSLYEDGQAIELVNIVTCLPQGYDEFLQVILGHLKDSFAELDIRWCAVLLQNLAKTHDPGLFFK